MEILRIDLVGSDVIFSSGVKQRGLSRDSQVSYLNDDEIAIHDPSVDKFDTNKAVRVYLPWLVEPAFTDVFDLIQNLQQNYFTSPSVELIDLRLIFGESFTGDGSTTTFQLDGSIINANFLKGTWDAAQVVTALNSNIVRNDNKKPTYDFIPNFLGNRISVLSISATGLVTLSHPPRSGVVFDIWYWYQMSNEDELGEYTREDIVSSMEADNSRIDAKIDYVDDKTGFVRIEDTTDTSGSPQAILSGVETLLPISADSVFDAESPGSLPASTLWDGSVFFPQTLGEMWSITISLTANPSLNNRNFDLVARINNAGQDEVFRRLSRLARGAGNNTPYLTTSDFPAYLSDEISSGIRFFILCDGDVDVFDKTIILSRKHRP